MEDSKLQYYKFIDFFFDAEKQYIMCDVVDTNHPLLCQKRVNTSIFNYGMVSLNNNNISEIIWVEKNLLIAEEYYESFLSFLTGKKKVLIEKMDNISKPIHETYTYLEFDRYERYAYIAGRMDVPAPMHRTILFKVIPLKFRKVIMKTGNAYFVVA